MMRTTLSLLFFLSLLLPSYAGVVTPQQFGAKADGIHDDTKAIQEALNQRGKVVFPDGTYLISSKLTIHSGTYLLGRKNAIIKQTEDTFILYNEHSQSATGIIDNGITVDGLILDGSMVDAKSEYAAGIYFCGVHNATVKNCRLIDIGGDGIYLGRGGKGIFCEYVRINNCTFTNCGRNATNPRQSIAVVFAEKVKITKCVMSNTRKSSYAVDVEPNNSDEHCSVVVTGCKMIGCGISSGGHKLAKKSLKVNKCHIDCGGTENATLAVVRTRGRITDNTIISNGKQNGISIVASPSITIKRNIINGASAGVLIAESADDVVVKNNRILNCHSGVYVMHSKGVEILSNRISTKGNGVYVRMKSDGARVEKNEIESEKGQDVYSAEESVITVRKNKRLR